MCSFRVGMKVICVKGCEPYGLIEGEIYEVEAVGCGLSGEPMIDVVGSPNALPGVLPRWFADRFRPVVTRKSDISIFKAMLTDQPERVGA